MKTRVLHTTDDLREFAARVPEWRGYVPIRVTVERYSPKRSTDQNARMWAMLTDVSQQVDWYGNRLTPEEWKQVFTAALRRQRAVPGIDGGFVVLGASTRKMSK